MRALAPFIYCLPLWVAIGGLHPWWLQLEPSQATGFMVFWTALTIDLVHGWLVCLRRDNRGDLNNGTRALGIPRIMTIGVGLIAAFSMLTFWGYVLGCLCRST